MEIKNIIGYEGLYTIDIEGNVYGKSQQHFLPHIMTRKGYANVRLCKKGRIDTYKIHELIAKHFLPNPKDLPEVFHIDRNPKNNKIDNLHWMRPSEIRALLKEQN